MAIQTQTHVVLTAPTTDVLNVVADKRDRTGTGLAAIVPPPASLSRECHSALWSDKRLEPDQRQRPMPNFGIGGDYAALRAGRSAVSSGSARATSLGRVRLSDCRTGSLPGGPEIGSRGFATKGRSLSGKRGK